MAKVVRLVPLLIALGTPGAFAQSQPSSGIMGARDILCATQPSHKDCLDGSATRSVPKWNAERDVTPPAPVSRPQRGSAGAVAGPAVPPAAPIRTGPSANLTVLFDLGSAQLTDEGRRQLDELALAILSGDASVRWLIEGHTDTRGAETMNRELSGMRARAAIDYLAAQHGIDRERLKGLGFGETRLAYPDGFDARNRRIEVSVLR